MKRQSNVSMILSTAHVPQAAAKAVKPPSTFIVVPKHLIVSGSLADIVDDRYDDDDEDDGAGSIFPKPKLAQFVAPPSRSSEPARPTRGQVKWAQSTGSSHGHGKRNAPAGVSESRTLLGDSRFPGRPVTPSLDDSDQSDNDFENTYNADIRQRDETSAFEQQPLGQRSVLGSPELSGSGAVRPRSLCGSRAGQTPPVSFALLPYAVRSRETYTKEPAEESCAATVPKAASVHRVFCKRSQLMHAGHCRQKSLPLLPSLPPGPSAAKQREAVQPAAIEHRCGFRDPAMSSTTRLKTNGEKCAGFAPPLKHSPLVPFDMGSKRSALVRAETLLEPTRTQKSPGAIISNEDSSEPFLPAPRSGSAAAGKHGGNSSRLRMTGMTEEWDGKGIQGGSWTPEDMNVLSSQSEVEESEPHIVLPKAPPPDPRLFEPVSSSERGWRWMLEPTQPIPWSLNSTIPSDQPKQKVINFAGSTIRDSSSSKAGTNPPARIKAMYSLAQISSSPTSTPVEYEPVRETSSEVILSSVTSDGAGAFQGTNNLSTLPSSYQRAVGAQEKERLAAASRQMRKTSLAASKPSIMMTPPRPANTSAAHYRHTIAHQVRTRVQQTTSDATRHAQHDDRRNRPSRTRPRRETACFGEAPV